ncbi:cytochrome P450 [Amycolatopsis sp. NPDC059090]|uniref:cytochrome P450 n=1 Tax=Amycolatopsis sp. NPDC059090 TaxID=3346723 RepID=UPI00366F4596
MGTSARESLSVADLPFVDVTAPGFSWDDPAVAGAREQCWVARTAVGLLALRHAEVSELARDPRMASDLRPFLERADVAAGPLYELHSRSMESRSVEDHRRLRGLITQPFTPRAVEAMLPLIRTAVREMAEDLSRQSSDAGAFDLVAALAERPLPVTVMYRLFGFPLEDYARDPVYRWFTDPNLVFALDCDRALLARLRDALADIQAYVETLLRKRVPAPGGNDLVSKLLRAQRAGILDWDELCGLIIALLVAGTDTTNNQLALALVAFARHPEQWAILRAHPELAEQAVTEVLRWCPTGPVMSHRTASEDFDYHGLHIPAGTAVWLGVHPAQRDPGAFPDGDTFDITVERTTPLVVFGGGAHYCPGSALGRAELVEALTALTARLGPPQIAGPITWRHPMGVFGPETLPLRFS